MIYISSSTIKSKKISDSVEILANSGFRNIELSGGTEYYPDIKRDLLDFQQKYEINFLCHNYFPPPKENFVINLASLNDEIHNLSFQNIKKSIQLSKELGANKFAFHAGFFVEILHLEIGRTISNTKFYEKGKAIEKFVDSVKRLQDFAKDIDLYIENNVYSKGNYEKYNGREILMLTCLEDFLELKNRFDFKLLLDFAHLKVSSTSMGLNFDKQITSLLRETDYLHLSDNDGMTDSNMPITNKTNYLSIFEGLDISKYDITIEVYDSLESVKSSVDFINSYQKNV